MTDIDWQGATRKGHLMDALYLLACRLAWLRHGDHRAHDELVRASVDADPDVRLIAATFLLELTPSNGQTFPYQAGDM
jgi:hypothetical protein